jgi:prophage regulatory protein
MRLIKRPEVERKTGKSCSRIYDDIRAGIFPKPVPIGPQAVAWVESEIDAWIEQRIAARDVREGK